MTDTSADLLHGFQAMGSPCRIRVAGAQAQQPAVQRAVQAAEAEVRRIEQCWSRYRADSIVSRINQAAGSPEPVPVDAETAAMLGFGAQLHQGSGGLFDLTSGVLRRVWDFKSGRPPEPDAVAALLPLIDWSAVEFDGTAVRLPRAGMELDFGGVGKEYAADRAATLLVEAGCSSGYVNLGGDLRLLGPMPDGAPWHLAIAHPREPGGVLIGVDLASGALATSGDYERYLEHAGRRYCHILNPRTGWPVACWQSVSVIAPACLAAGALSTIAMLMGEGAPDFLRAQGVGAVLVDADGRMIPVGPCAEGFSASDPCARPESARRTC